MSTRSAIIIVEEDCARGIYCHSDGYPSWNGKILLKYYKSRAKVKNLIALGDLSSLDANVKPPKGKEHSFDSPAPKTTVAYMRDRGEDGCEAITGDTAGEVADEIDNGGNVYVYGLDNKWTFNGVPLARVPMGED